MALTSWQSGVYKKCSQREKGSRTGWKDRLIVLKDTQIEYYAKPKVWPDSESKKWQRW